MALTSTRPLPVFQVFYTASGSAKLTFILKPPLPPLFIGSICITRVTSGPALVGTLSPAPDATPPGKVLLQMNPTAFTDVQTLAVLPFQVVIGYDSETKEVVQLDILHNSALATQESVDELQASVNTLLKSLKPVAAE